MAAEAERVPLNLFLPRPLVLDFRTHSTRKHNNSRKLSQDAEEALRSWLEGEGFYPEATNGNSSPR